MIEESARFAREDPFLTEQCKGLRHRLNREVARIRHQFAVELARDTPGDVGTAISTSDESVRKSVAEVIRANFSRLKESLRCLEEYAKLICPEVSAAFERIRYDAYTLERAFVSVNWALDRFRHAHLYAIVDGQRSHSDFVTLVESLAAEVDVLQLRDKQLDGADLLERAVELVRICRNQCISIINDRVDVALAAQADGVHVGQSDLPVRSVRQVCGPDMIVGVSTHALAEARSAVLDGATYIGVGPVFPTETKHFDEFVGTVLVQQVAAEIQLPAFAIGGVTLDNVDQVIRAGLRRVAVSSFLTRHPQAANAARSLRERLRPGD